MIIKFLIGIVIAYLALVVLTYFMQRSMMYYPTRHIAAKPENMQSVQLTTNDNLQLNAWYHPAKIGMPTLIYFHGNAGNFSSRYALVETYIEKGYGVLLASYRGYAGNPGHPHEKGLYKDADAALNFLKQNNISNKCIILFGESLGAAVAIHLANEHQVAGLILQSAFTSMTAVGQLHYPILPIKWLLKDRYNSQASIKNIHVPLLFLQGENDKIVPATFSKQLFASANEPKKIQLYANVGHNDIVSQQLQNDVLTFLNQFKSCQGNS